MKASARSAVPAFQVMSVLDRVAQLRAQGKDVISLCAGEPSGGAPGAVRDLAADAHAGRAGLGYTSALGLQEVRQAIAEHYSRWYHLEVAAEQVAVTTGSSGAFMLTFLAAFDPGDVVVLARPGYPAYRNILT
ncbi:MAG TPA: aminotransferase class I/II-fold pyridoxal phosphate-dependent enzyme, partial [Beutenbergiaceae bacterium]|nr:aminotransferase class I/II-fold pyridoxal phosphate-dependent enzyme [Beutenbergiaceae bacterium]